MKSWHGVLVATAIPYDDRLGVDLDRFAEHVAWLAENGCHGVVPNGSLGEYQVLTDDERAAVVRTAVEAAPDGFHVVPGVAAYGAGEARAWAEQAAAGRRRRRAAAATEFLPGRRARRPRALRRGGEGGAAGCRLQQPDRHQGRPHAEPSREAPRRRQHRRGQGVLGGHPARLRDRGARPGARPARRRRRRAARADAGRRLRLDRRLPQLAADQLRRAI